jgi:four helix bundle protein
MTDRSNPVLEKSYRLALSVIPVASKLQKSGEHVLSRQLVRSGTSIGANVEEAQAAQSRADFHARLCIAEKEARETSYWLRLLKDSGLLKKSEFDPLFALTTEVLKLLTSITKKTKS